MNPKAKGIVGIAWFVVGGGFASLSSLMMVFMHSGGVTAPGPVWAASLAIAAFGTPVVVALAGIPLAYHIYNERPAMKVGLVSLAATFAIFVLSWVVPIVARAL